jgi:hypothetical protein
VAVCPIYGKPRPAVVRPDAEEAGVEEPEPTPSEPDWTYTVAKITTQAHQVRGGRHWGWAWCRVGAVGTFLILTGCFLAHDFSRTPSIGTFFAVIFVAAFFAVVVGFFCGLAGVTAEAIYGTIKGPPQNAARLLEAADAEDEERKNLARAVAGYGSPRPACQAELPPPDPAAPLANSPLDAITPKQEPPHGGVVE